MCYVKRKDGKSAKKMVRKRYERQKERGKEGYGYVAIDDNYLVACQKATTEKVIMAAIELETADEMLFHHRMPTSTPNFAEAAHPITVRHESLKYDYYVVHNGVIFEDEKLKAKHEALGFIYTTELITQTKSRENVLESKTIWNDSEALAIELALDFDKSTSGIPHVRGSIAFIVIQSEKETAKAVKLFYGRNFQSPLCIDEHQDYTAITSTGKGDLVTAHTLFAYDYESTKTEEKHYSIGGNSTYDVDGFDADDGWVYRNGVYTFHPEMKKETTRQIGFYLGDKEKELKELVGEKEEALATAAFDEYYELLEEQNEIEELLKSWDELGGEDEDKPFYEERLITISEDIKHYDDLFTKNALRTA